MRCRMAVEFVTGGIRRVGSSSNDERAALEGMLKGYPVEQLVEEVLVARMSWASETTNWLRSSNGCVWLNLTWLNAKATSLGGRTSG